LISGFWLFRLQSGLLSKHYAQDRLVLSQATILANIFLGCAVIVLIFSVSLKLVFPELMDETSRQVFIVLDISLITLCVIAYGALLQGHFDFARGLFTATAAVSILAGIMLTGGFPNSLVTPCLVLFPVIAYLFYGGKTGFRLTIAIMAVVLVQWYAVAHLGLVLPDYTSKASPSTNSFIIFTMTFGAVMAIIGIYHSRNQALQLALSEERRNFAEQANQDALTKLGNSRYFYDELEKHGMLAKEKGRRLALFYIDLDRFKMINDTFGHQVGDKVLKITARRIEQCIRKDDIVARVGGDEFAVLMKSQVSDKEIGNIQRRLRSITSDPIGVGDENHQIGISVGISVFPDGTKDVKQLLQDADKSMYRDKSRNQERFKQRSSQKAQLPGSKDVTRVA